MACLAEDRQLPGPRGGDHGAVPRQHQVGTQRLLLVQALEQGCEAFRIIEGEGALGQQDAQRLQPGVHRDEVVAERVVDHLRRMRDEVARPCDRQGIAPLDQPHRAQADRAHDGEGRQQDQPHQWPGLQA
jgi:hypothetical protein